MNSRRIFPVILGIALLAGAPNAEAQSFKDKLKKAAEKVSKQVQDEVSKQLPKESKSSKSSKKGKSNKRSAGNTATVNLPDNHTAILAPLGEQVDAKLGIKTSKATRPPKEETKQPDWNDARPSANELDNQSLVDEYMMLLKCLESKYFSATSPAFSRFAHQVEPEIMERVNALDDMVEQYYETIDTYSSDDGDSWVDVSNRALASKLKSRGYKIAIRSSLAPLKDLLNKQTIEYFNTHGGLANAHKGNWTVWNPDQSK